MTRMWKMNENKILIAQRKRREDAIKNINENFSLVQENQKIAEQKKQAETEEAFKVLKKREAEKGKASAVYYGRAAKN